MKIETSLLNAVRFPADSNTKLHFHTGNVDAESPTVVDSAVGDKLFLRKKDPTVPLFPLVDVPTPYGAGPEEFTGFEFSTAGHNNYATTAASEPPVQPEFISDLVERFRMSMFLKPEVATTGGARVLVTGVPGMFGVYQQDSHLVLALESSGVTYFNTLSYVLEAGAWHLLDVQWDKDKLSGWPTWYVNGVAYPSTGDHVEDSLEEGDRFNVAYDPLLGTGQYWKGVIREVGVNSQPLLPVEVTTPEDFNSEIYARAMRLFGLATDTTPVPRFTRDSVAWVRVGGVLHKVSYHHPRASEKGTLVEEERTNLIEDSDGDPYSLSPITLVQGRYTAWIEQKNLPTEAPEKLKLTLTEGVEVTGVFTVAEGEPIVFEVKDSGGGSLALESEGGGTFIHMQIEDGVGPTSPIVTDGVVVTRAVETLEYPITASDLDQEQGRVDLEVTPLMDGVRAEVGDVGTAGDILGLSLVHEEIVSVDGGGDEASLPGEGLWKTGVTRSLHVEWQPGARIMMEDSLRLVAAADYSGSWPWPGSGPWLYVGGGGDGNGMRANSYFRGLVLDDWVPRFHADLHRFMYRQFGTGGFSEDEDSTFRKWRRVEGDGLGLLARLGDSLKDEAFADSVDTMVEEWEKALGLSSLWGTSREERREVLANLFRAIGAEDVEIEEGVSYLTGTASVIERHLEDVGEDLRQMYEYYVKIPESYYRQTYLQLIRFLLERQEPAHTVGYPIVRTEFVTGSDDYGSVVVGPVEEVDVIPFEELESKTERDCVGLVGGQFFLPQGMWLPTNRSGSFDDPWSGSLPEIQLPSVLFPITEALGELNDEMEGVVQLSPVGSPRYLLHCSGLLVGDKREHPVDSEVQLNIPRGVEFVDVADRFETSTATEVFRLGVLAKWGAFLHVFRMTELPGATEERNLFYCTDDATTPNYYRLFVDENGLLTFELEGIENRTVSASRNVKKGEWVCVLVVIGALEGTERKVQLHVSDGGVESSAQILDWTMTGSTITFTLGGPGGTSAKAHHSYLAGWSGPGADELGGEVLERIWRGLRAAYGFTYGRYGTGEGLVGWPVGKAPDEDVGQMAARYNRWQLPYAALGVHGDGYGVVQDVRGFGCNRSITNWAPDSESIEDGWLYDTGVTRNGDLVVSPSGLTEAAVGNWTGNARVTAGFVFTVSSGDVGYAAVSCWVKRMNAGTGTPVCELVLLDADGVKLPVLEGFTAEHEVGGEWKRIWTVFKLDGSGGEISSARAGIAFNGVEEIGMWGFQFVKEPVLSPYVPNGGTSEVSVEASKLAVDDEEFGGFEDRGFVSMRVKLEEIVNRESDSPLVLMEAFDGDTKKKQAILEVHGSVEPAELTFTFRLLLGSEVGDWQDEVSLTLGSNGVGEEHHVAVGWDLLRPMALGFRHVALWVDGVQAEGGPLPVDPMDQSVFLDKLRIGHDDQDTADNQNQPCAVIREVLLFSRHLPGVYSPTRLKMSD